MSPSRLGRALVAALLLAAAPSWAERPRVVVLGLSASNEKLRAVGETIAEQILTELGRTELVDAMGTSDVQALLGMERQKQMLGCSDSSASCLAEISSALGAPWLVTGSLGQLGKAMRLDIKLIRARDGKAVFRDGKVMKDESEVFDNVTDIVKRMVAKMDLGPAPKPPVAEAKPPVAEPKPVLQPESTPTTAPAPVVEARPEAGPSTLSRVGPWVAVGVGAAAAVAGGVLVAGGRQKRQDVLSGIGSDLATPATDGTPTYGQSIDRLTTANREMWMGGAIAGAGVLAVAGGVAWKLLGSKESAPAVVTVTPGLGTVVVSGEF